MQFLLALALTVLTGWVSPRGWKVNRIEVEAPAATRQEIKEPVVPRDSGPWGVVEKIGEHTYSIRVENDAKMSSSDEILRAINDLRARNGVQKLQKDDRLCKYARERAEYFDKIGQTDEHAGFIDFLENQDGFAKLGYGLVGENSPYGYVLSGVHLVEWVYMRSPEHNKNQLDPRWDRGCAGTGKLGTNIIFTTAPL